jgi:hypothetical protein
MPKRDILFVPLIFYFYVIEKEQRVQRTLHTTNRPNDGVFWGSVGNEWDGFDLFVCHILGGVPVGDPRQVPPREERGDVSRELRGRHTEPLDTGHGDGTHARHNVEGVAIEGNTAREATAREATVGGASSVETFAH